MLASALVSKIWPRPQTFGLGLASISLSYYVIGYFSGKNRVNSGILLIFPAIILAPALVSTSRNWPRPRPRPRSSGLGLGLEVLASFNITSCYHLIAHMSFPIGGPLEPSLYLYRFLSYSMANLTQWLT